MIYVDRFGNLVTTVGLTLIPPVRRATLGGRVIDGPLSKGYADREPGELLLIGGSSGFLEISVNRGSAAAVLGVRRGSGLVVEVESPPAQGGG